MTDLVRKRVAARTALRFAPVAPGLTGVDLLATQHAIEPFLVFTEFLMGRPVFGPHPHAGVSVMTYILPDSAGGFLNRDSQGDRSEIGPGAVHVTQAGRGIHHDEVPLVTGVAAHGFQIWVNHREQDRWVAPRAMHADAADVPDVRHGGSTVRVLHGSFGGQSPRYRMVTPVTLLHVRMAPGAGLVLPAAAMAFVYGLAGAAASDGAALQPQVLLTYDTHGDAVRLDAGADGAELMFGSGTPIGEPILYGGPFVMTTEAQMTETRRRHARGEMGALPPLRP
jgi:redox-sensitive bicupin YhaK (pirin superfamily)